MMKSLFYISDPSSRRYGQKVTATATELNRGKRTGKMNVRDEKGTIISINRDMLIYPFEWHSSRNGPEKH